MLSVLGMESGQVFLRPTRPASCIPWHSLATELRLLVPVVASRLIHEEVGDYCALLGTQRAVHHCEYMSLLCGTLTVCH